MRFLWQDKDNGEPKDFPFNPWVEVIVACTTAVILSLAIIGVAALIGGL